MTTVRLLESPDEDAWEHFVASHPRADIYHSLAWRAVTCEGFGHAARHLVARDAAGNVTGVLPLFRVNGFTGHRLVSVPMRDRGGPVARDAATENQLLAAAIDLCRQSGAQYLDVRTLHPLDDASTDGLALVKSQHWVTSRVDLRGGSDAVWKRLHQKVRQHVRKAEGEGVTIDIDASREGIVRFFDAFVSVRTSMGIPPFPRTFIDAVWRHLIVPGKANLVLASNGTTLINAMINFLSKDTVIAAYSAPKREWFRQYPAEMVYWHTMSWGAKAGYTTFDFGADSPRQEGLIAFKGKFGAATTTMSSYSFLHRVKSPPDFDSSSPAYDLVRRVWSWLPGPVSRAAGAWVTRRLS